ncbi:hypothetical protein G6F59_018615 [Rhizopus arrhizus]|nr:hypothetical protein G6F59_018615 [Rhizopus arrhizus]
MAPDNHRALAPHASSARPKRSGAAACAIRAGIISQPWRAPYPSEPNSASGKVPFAMVRMPLPAPWRTANTGAIAGPAISSTAAPAGCAIAAKRADSSG